MLPKAFIKRIRRLQLDWYRIYFAAILLGPALFCQMLIPMVSYETWENLSEPVYAALLRWQDLPPLADSRVVVLEVDQATLETYGWPIDRSYYVQLLLKLQESGHPWILSLIQFQTMEKAKSGQKERQSAAAKDLALASAIKSYGRFVGSGLKIEAGEELSAEAESTLLPQVLLTRDGNPLDELPYLPLHLVESERFVAAQQAFGYGTHLGTEATIHCMQMYLTDKEHLGEFVIPSSLVWAATYATQSHLATATTATWPRASDRLSYSPSGRLKIGYQHCLSSPGVLTNDFITRRGIERISLTTFLESEESQDLTGKVVLLASPDMRRFQGPGTATTKDNGIVSESLLAARFLDDLLTKRMIRREELRRHWALAWLPLALAVALALGAWFLSPLGAIALSLALIGGLLAFSAIRLAEGDYLILTPSLASVTLTALGLGLLYAYLRYDGARRQIRFSSNLRDRLAQCNNLDELERQAQAVCQAEFSYASLTFTNFDREIYEASADPTRALALLNRRSDTALAGESQFHARVETIQTNIKHLVGLSSMPLRSRGMELSLTISSNTEKLGTLKLHLTYKTHEQAYLPQLLDLLQVEVTQHWRRIKILVDQKLLDYRFLMEQTRGDIMERFLTQVIVSKFSNTKTMMENLRAVLTPRPTKAALMQADIRGYSRVSAKLEPLEMVRLLQSYYRNVVDAAQLVAQVKLIGDCIFLFIEDAAGSSTHSPADMALELAQILIAETNQQNASKQAQAEDCLTFGIAIHYGDVVAGNLSSESCIDYTVIGPNVNMVARLEEFTKNPKIAQTLGPNGVLVTEAAEAAMIRHKGTEFLTFDLESDGLSVRSFSDIKRIKGLTAEMALGASAPNKLLPVALVS